MPTRITLNKSERALHYHIVTHGDKAGSEIFTIHHTSLLLQGMMQKWKKPREKRETSPGRNEPTGDITKNEFQGGRGWKEGFTGQKKT